MADYIERQAAIDAFNRIKNTLKNPKTAHYDTLMFYEIEDVLEDVEPADVVQVVRCRDCKNRDEEDSFCTGRGFPYQLVPDDGFCDKGKRREEQTNDKT